MTSYMNYDEWRDAYRGGTPAEYQAYVRTVTRTGGDWLNSLPDRPADDLVTVREGERRYTRREVEHALNRAANLVQDTHDYENGDTLASDAAVDLVANAAGYLLDHPDAPLDEIIPALYTEVEIYDYELDEGEAPPEKGSERWNELLVEKVLGWLA